MEEPIVYVLLATYNGRAYIREMIDSVLAQDYERIRLILSDDGSSDGTDQILDEYEQMHPQKITHYRSGMKFGCAQKHFMHLLSVFCDAPYMMFCDQDDVWHKDKISKTLRKMQELECEALLPAMVHTDLRVVDSNLKEIARSFWEYSNLDGGRLALNHLMVQNVVTGCAMMINHPLAKLASKKIPEELIMHDWWIALLAAACGRAGYLPEATIDYRQHGNNAVGAKNVHSVTYLWQRLTSKSMRASLRNNARQAQALAECYGDCLSNEAMSVISAFVKAQSENLFKRDYIYIKYDLLKYGFVRKICQLIGL